MYTCYFLIFVYQSMKLSEDNKANCNEYTYVFSTNLQKKQRPVYRTQKH